MTDKVDPGIAGLAHLKGLVAYLENHGHRDMPEVVSARTYLTSLEPPKAAEGPHKAEEPDKSVHSSHK